MARCWPSATNMSAPCFLFPNVDGGFSPDNPNSSDFYATGDARRVTADRYIHTRSGAIKRSKRKRRKKKIKHSKK